MKNYRIVENIKDECFYVEYQKDFFGFNKWFKVRCNFGDYNNINYFDQEWWWLLLPVFIITLVPIIIFLIHQYDFNTIKKFRRSEVKEYLNFVKKEEEKEEKIRTKGKEKVIGIYMNGEFIDVARLERMKKLERIVEK